MPGGAKAAWPLVKDIFQSVSAKVADENGNEVVPCCDWVGDAGAGHFVKMVHNGIEYADKIAHDAMIKLKLRCGVCG